MSSTIQKRPPWAKLLFNPDVFKDPVEIVDERIVIGRAPGCAVCLRDNKNVSAQHCAIERAADGRVYIADLGANGTFVNVTERVEKGKRTEITDGSVVFLVKKRGNPAADLGFTVKLVGSQLVANRTFSNTLSAAVAPVHRSDRLSEIIDSVVSSLHSQRPEEEEPAIKKFRSMASADNAASVRAGAQRIASTSAPNSNTEEAAAVASVASSSSTHPRDSSIADNLVCSICFDIIHDCVTLQPCMHCFCAGCYSEWLSRSELCPDCRATVRRINKNHVLNNVISAYLAEHPDKKRSDEEIKRLDAQNKLTPEMLKGKRKKKRRSVAGDADNHGSDCECSECDEDYSSSEESDDDGGTGAAAAGNLRIAAPAYHNPQCRLCVGYRGFPVLNARVRPVDPNARLCPPGQPHIMCECCFANMPDRRQENNPALPPITCAICHRAFCDMVFGCCRAGCVGCLARFKDVAFPAATYDLIINENPFETTVLKNYLAKTRKTWKDILTECMGKFDRNEYHCRDRAAYNLSSESPLCQVCALRNFRELVYQYRQQIPKEELPADVTRRKDCYWGKNCRTQKKFHHAANYNHICEQTKFVP